MQYVLCDAQTSGGLLVCVPSDSAQTIVKELAASPLVLSASIIGRTFSHPTNEAPTIHVHKSPPQQ